MNLQDALGSALESLQGNRLRTLLTLLGVVIGVSIVILLVSMGESARMYVSNQVQGMGLGPSVLVIHPGKNDPPIEASRLTYDDAMEIARRVPDVVDVLPVVVGSVEVKAHQAKTMTTAWGVTGNYTTLVGYHVREGRFFDDNDVHRRKKVCVLGQKVRNRLFGSVSPLGETLRVGDTKFECLGVMEQKGEMLGLDLDDIVIMPVTTGADLLETSRLLEIIAWTRGPEHVPAVAESVKDMLASRHKRTDDFHMHSQGELMSTLSKITGALTTFVAAIAAISLIVGSIGIMNIMLVSVTERTREIGIRKAIGARRGDLFVQFLVEALLISLMGGVLGIALGAGISIGVLSLIELPVIVTPWAVAAAAGASILVGLVSGVYPAMRAADLDPVAALRYE